MTGTMNEADLIADLKGILQGASKKFTAPADADYIRHLTLAALDLARVRPRIVTDSITLQADVRLYTAPAGMIRAHQVHWGRQAQLTLKPWDGNYPSRLPTVSLVESPSGRMLALSFAPTSNEIASLGSVFEFDYYASHVIGSDATDTTIQPSDRYLLLIRAAAEALQELALSGSSAPVELGRVAGGSMPRNGTPGALAESLLALFERMAP